MKPSEDSSTEAVEFNPSLDQAEFERQFFLHVLGRCPNHIDALRRMVEIYAVNGEHARAVPLDHRLVTLLPHNCVVRYNLACGLAMTGQSALALETLEKSLQLGYSDLPHLESDPDLEPLREHPRYRDLIDQYLSVPSNE